MTCLVVSCATQEVETVLAEAAFIDLAGVQEEDGRLRLWLADDGDASRLRLRLDKWLPVVERVEPEQNWNEAWQSEWRPMVVGERFYLAPPGDESLTPAGRIRLAMHPGMAFGNGDHPTTHLCLMAIERELRAGDTFLDVGCGSGLVGEAARALGARRVGGCDPDPAVVRPPDAFAGSVDAVRSASCDVVTANIQLGVLERLMPEIVRVMRPGARLVLSGVLPDQLDLLRATVTVHGLRAGAEAELQGWASLLARMLT